jgi:hypothetical protein
MAEGFEGDEAVAVSDGDGGGGEGTGVDCFGEDGEGGREDLILTFVGWGESRDWRVQGLGARGKIVTFAGYSRLG